MKLGIEFKCVSLSLSDDPKKDYQNVRLVEIKGSKISVLKDEEYWDRTSIYLKFNKGDEGYDMFELGNTYTLDIKSTTAKV